MNLVSVLPVLLIGGTFIWMAALMAYRSKGHTGAKKWLIRVGGILLAIGGLGFFGSVLSAVGGLRWLPNTFEWPIGLAHGVITMPDGTHVVPHAASGRIQVYDQDWKFIRGWSVDASGGVFILRVAKTNHIEVITARRQMRYLYGLDGSLLSQERYAPQSYSDFPATSASANVPTPWYLQMFTSPGYSWMTMATGMMLLFLADRTKARKISDT